MTTTITLTPEHLDLAVRCTHRFRHVGDGRPSLSAVHVRLKPGSERRHLEVTATDSYHLVRITVPVQAVKDPRGQLARGGGVLLDLPAVGARRFLAAIQKAERARLKDEQRAREQNERQRRLARFRKQPEPPAFKAGAPAAVKVTITDQGEVDTRFGLSADGAWNGGGCFVVADGAVADRVDQVVGGGRCTFDYPDVDNLLERAGGPGAELRDGQQVAYNPALLADICTAAAAFGKNAPIRVDTVDQLKPSLFSMKAPIGQGIDDCTFLGLIMPVRVS